MKSQLLQIPIELFRILKVKHTCLNINFVDFNKFVLILKITVFNYFVLWIPGPKVADSLIKLPTSSIFKISIKEMLLV